MKKRLSRPIVCALGVAALLSSCASKTTTATSTPAPVSGVSTPVATVETPALATAATPGISATPGTSLTPSASGTPIAAVTPGVNAGMPVVEGVSITVAKAGSGEPIASGTAGSFHYTGWLEGFDSAKKFDSSRERDPFDLVLGQGMVIPGWDQGLVGMQPGEIRRLEITAPMAYGAEGRPPAIPPNATLYFEVEYLGPKK